EETPTEAELQTLIEKSGLEPKKFFNTSGKLYRENNMKDKLKAADLNQMVTYLAADGMLIKRPIVTDGEKVTVGFNEKIFKDTWIKETDLNNWFHSQFKFGFIILSIKNRRNNNE